MPRIHPHYATSESPAPLTSIITAGDEPAAFTVWRKSLLLNCSGFTVYNAEGNLFFRVENYPSSSLNKIVLMNPIGIPLFTVRRKRFTLMDQWEIYKGAESEKPCFSARKHFALLRSESLAHLTACGVSGGGIKSKYDVEGSFSKRSCVVYDERRVKAAEIRRKEVVCNKTFNGDVFRLIVQPGFDAALAMAIVIVLEQMTGLPASSV
ncbi:Protein LURP-one-related 8 [Platanthera zijinensis]|uniref:Protein LURP-one-related 8 n=1 Tax=Platanthera zijinensis TaxID=2320716 RepID=A0AAP0B3Q9_9ASPA